MSACTFALRSICLASPSSVALEFEFLWRFEFGCLSRALQLQSTAGGGLECARSCLSLSSSMSAPPSSISVAGPAGSTSMCARESPASSCASSFLRLALPAGHWYEAIEVEAKLVATDGVEGGQTRTVVARYGAAATAHTGWQMQTKRDELFASEPAKPTAQDTTRRTTAGSTPSAQMSVAPVSVPKAATSGAASLVAPKSDPSTPAPPPHPGPPPAASSASTPPTAVRQSDLPRRVSSVGALQKIAPHLAGPSLSQPAPAASREAARSGALEWHRKANGKPDDQSTEKRRVHKILGRRKRGDIQEYLGQLTEIPVE